MSGKAARAKGLAFEREIAERLRIVFPKARRQLEFHKDDAKGVDLQNTGPFRFQIKKLKKYVPITTIQEIEFDEWDVPVLVTAGDGLPAMAVLTFNDLVWLLKLANAWG